MRKILKKIKWFFKSKFYIGYVDTVDLEDEYESIGMRVFPNFEHIKDKKCITQCGAKKILMIVIKEEIPQDFSVEIEECTK